MKNKKIFFSLFGLILIIAFVISFYRDKSVLPLKPESVTSIYFTNYPQYDGNYTVTNNSRIKDIVSVINELNVQEAPHADKIKMSSYHYWFFINTLNDDISVKLGENVISLNNEIYQADTSDLCILLDQTYNDIMHGKID